MAPPTPRPVARSSQVRLAINELKWTQGKLARRIDVTEETVSRWCIGKARVPLVVILYLEQIVHAKKLYSP